ncbi:MAG: DUF2975 domain-containing protein [Desulfobacteraceae bacterium]|nr:DUF2975 domain-containing protein [Desulfobacteraceae bacterium]
MDNLSKIKQLSKIFNFLISFLLVMTPIYYFFYWVFINYLPSRLISVNTPSMPLVADVLSIKLQIIGFMASLFPVSALMYLLLNVRRLFAFYEKGIFFSSGQSGILKKNAIALVLWVVLQIVYESAKSVIFSVNNPVGHRICQVDVHPAQITALLAGGVIFIIAWVMDQARIIKEENELTV